MKDIMIATGNLNKVKEYKEILEPLGFVIHDLSEINHTDVEETGTTFSENALLKAESVVKSCKMICIADDSGLSITALDGAPGIYSARFMGDKTNTETNAVIIEMLKDKADRSAWFTCAIALIDHEGESHLFEGIMEGSIAFEPKGSNGFGYDPIFIPKGLDKTSAELTSAEKNAISHRGKATRLLLEYLKENY